MFFFKCSLNFALERLYEAMSVHGNLRAHWLGPKLIFTNLQNLLKQHLISPVPTVPADVLDLSTSLAFETRLKTRL